MIDYWEDITPASVKAQILQYLGEPMPKDRYTRSVLTAVQSEVNMYAIAMQDITKPEEPRHQILDTGSYYTRDEAIERATALNISNTAELHELGFSRFVPYNMWAE